MVARVDCRVSMQLHWRVSIIRKLGCQSTSPVHQSSPVTVGSRTNTKSLHKKVDATARTHRRLEGDDGLQLCMLEILFLLSIKTGVTRQMLL